MNHRVVITGLGPVTRVGIGRKAFFEGVWGLGCPACPIPAAFARGYTFQSRWFVPLPEISLAEHHLEVPHEAAMQAADRMVVLGAKLAFEDAGYGVAQVNGRLSVRGLEDCSVLLGAGLGSMQTAFDSHLCQAVPPDVLHGIFPGQSLRYSRMVVPRSMPNSPAAWASICFGLGGPCSTLNASCASGTYAVGEAFRRVRDGYERVVLTGGVECLQDSCGTILRGFDVLGVLTRSPDGRPTPFGKGRSGFLFAEGGACLLVLEEVEHARRRGAPIYAEILDYQANSDAHNIVQADPEGRQVIRLLRGLSTGRRIDYLNAHGTGTVANDEVEARAIRAVFGGRDTQPLINSTKGILGHTLGASGAIEVAVTALSIARDTVHGNLVTEPLDDLNLPLAEVPGPVENAISVSYGFGGHNGGLRLSKCHADG
jgi:3-oxoacyl-[acyl-carrier-protein] synthase II